jgi:hypothetical protein
MSNLSLGNGVEKSTQAICGLTAGNGLWQPATTPAASNNINLRMMNVPLIGDSEHTADQLR